MRRARQRREQMAGYQRVGPGQYQDAQGNMVNSRFNPGRGRKMGRKVLAQTPQYDPNPQPQPQQGGMEGMGGQIGAALGGNSWGGSQPYPADLAGAADMYQDGPDQVDPGFMQQHAQFQPNMEANLGQFQQRFPGYNPDPGFNMEGDMRQPPQMISREQFAQKFGGQAPGGMLGQPPQMNPRQQRRMNRFMRNPQRFMKRRFGNGEM